MSAVRCLVALILLCAMSAGARAYADVPPVSPQARAAGFVDVRSVVPNALIDLRYATPNNFTHTQLYPAGARCLVDESLAPGLASAAKALAATGDLLVFWDCYRPHDVQVKMFDVVPNPAWVAKPGNYAKSHESGRSVDVTLGNMTEQCPHCLSTWAQISMIFRRGQRLSPPTGSASASGRTGPGCAMP